MNMCVCPCMCICVCVPAEACICECKSEVNLRHYISVTICLSLRKNLSLVETWLAAALAVQKNPGILPVSAIPAPGLQGLIPGYFFL